MKTYAHRALAAVVAFCRNDSVAMDDYLDSVERLVAESRGAPPRVAVGEQFWEMLTGAVETRLDNRLGSMWLTDHAARRVSQAVIAELVRRRP